MKKLLLSFAAMFMAMQAAAQKAELVYDLRVGETCCQTINTVVESEAAAQGMAITVNMEIIVGISYKVIADNGDSYEMEAEYTRMVVDTRNPYASTRIDSDMPDNDFVSKAFAAMTGNPFRMGMSKRGRVLYVGDTDGIVEKVMQEAGELSGSEKDQLEDLIRESFGGEALEGNFRLVHDMFPEGVIFPGHKWGNTVKLNMGFPMEIAAEYEYVGIEDNDYILTALAVADTGPEGIDVVLDGMPGKYIVGGTYVYDIRLDRETCWTSQATIDMSMDVLGLIDMGYGETEMEIKMEAKVYITDK